MLATELPSPRETVTSPVLPVWPMPAAIAKKPVLSSVAALDWPNATLTSPASPLLLTLIQMLEE